MCRAGTTCDAYYIATLVAYRGKDGEPKVLPMAVNVETGEVKYYASNDLKRSAQMLLRVGLRRAPIEHLFRLVKQEAGFAHFEGRNYRALMRHMTMAL